ncbi:MAG: hypothetical protein Q8O88_02270 [bacterium]|nr:hypothetical protein [bacterium]
MISECGQQVVEAECCDWDDTKLRHAYLSSNRQVAFCGYDGPSTWKGEWEVPSNACPICLAILPEYFDMINRKRIK